MTESDQAVQWSKVTKARTNNFLEINLTGEDINVTLKDDDKCFDYRMFQIKNLNTLGICHSNIKIIPDTIGSLKNLINISFYNNKITTLPITINQLGNLKNIDLSGNSITHLPEDVFLNCHSLESINISNNCLEKLPNLKSLTKLHHLRAPHNKLDRLPASLTVCEKLLTLDFAHNQVKCLPLDIGNLVSLRTLRGSNNELEFLPRSMVNCKRLVDVYLDGNGFGGDRKLKKLATQMPMNTKSLYDYVGKLKDPSAEEIENLFVPCDNDDRSTSEDDAEEEENIEPITKAIKEVVTLRDDAPKADDDTNPAFIQVSAPTINPQNYVMYVENLVSLKKLKKPHIIACVVRNVSFHSDQKFVKAFLKHQATVHNGSLCNKRCDATIATHDLSKLELPLTANVLPLNKITIHPINMDAAMTAQELATLLRNKADLERKDKKRNTISPAHKYLNAIGATALHVKSGVEGEVISCYPLSNCHNTRIAVTTKSMLIEVNAKTQALCKKVMESLLKWLMQNAVPKGTELLGGNVKRPLILNQVRVVQYEDHNNLLVVYPSHDDLREPEFGTVWENEK